VIRPVNNGDGFNRTSVYPINTGLESGNYVFIFLRLSGNFFSLDLKCSGISKNLRNLSNMLYNGDVFDTWIISSLPKVKF
jgi:hypothetical protein